MLNVKIFPNREAMGKEAAAAVSDHLSSLLESQGSVRIVFAAAPSQNEFLSALAEARGIDWGRVTAFHMDEYLGLDQHAEQLFGRYLDEKIFRRVSFGEIHRISSHPAQAEEECKRYSALLREAPLDIVCLGIGENGHIAFNDPHVADFNDPFLVKVVSLDERSREQQVHDKCFRRAEDVPKNAITLTIPALLSGRSLFVVVPGPAKAHAVFETMTGEISAACPASILRTHPDAVMYLDRDAASQLDQTS
jgi:glucosamine-6-phosphate deaminase